MHEGIGSHKARKSLVSSSDFSFFLGVLFLGGGGLLGELTMTARHEPFSMDVQNFVVVTLPVFTI